MGLILILGMRIYINEDATPHLILERKSSYETVIKEGDFLQKALLQNGWLITLERIGRKGSPKLCLESIEQLTGK